MGKNIFSADAPDRYVSKFGVLDVIPNRFITPGRSIAEEAQEVGNVTKRFVASLTPRQLLDMRIRIAKLRAQDNRATRGYAYWQFKNGSIVRMKSGVDLPTFDSGIEWDVCWDRSLGAEVCYER